MGLAKRQPGAVLFAGLLTAECALLPDVRRSLEKAFGRCEYESAWLDFTHTDYYDREMGSGLKRKFLAFGRLIDLESAYTAKIATNRLELRFAKDGRRAVNIDPGYLTLAKVALFSTKDYSHRIYLKEGIFAEATLHYARGEYRPWPWTYPDYATKEYGDIFSALRARLKNGERGPAACC
jgi:hypothetical protein